MVMRELLTDISVAKACKVELEGGPREGWCCHHLLEVRPPGVSSVSNATCKGSGFKVRQDPGHPLIAFQHREADQSILAAGTLRQKGALLQFSDLHQCAIY